MNVRFGLDKVRKLLSDENNWTKVSLAVDSDGKSTGSNSPDACKWCLMGAVYHCVSDIYVRIEVNEALRMELPKKYSFSLGDFNDDDETTHSDLIGVINQAVIKKAIANL